MSERDSGGRGVVAAADGRGTGRIAAPLISGFSSVRGDCPPIRSGAALSCVGEALYQDKQSFTPLSVFDA